MAVLIQLRRDSAADWASVNPTLAEGEVGLELDTGRLKYGDGATAWSSLPYFGHADRYAVDVGDGAETVYVVTHGLGSEDVTWQVRDNTTGGKVYDAGIVLNSNQIRLEFEEPPTVNQYRAVVKL